MQQRGGAHRTGRPERMAERNGAAQRIHLRRIETKILDYRQRLRGKRLVQFDPVKVCHLQAGLTQHFGDRLDRPDTHDLGRHTGHRITKKTAERIQIKALHRFLAHQDDDTSTVRHLRTVASGDRTSGGEHRLESGEPLHRGIAPRPFIGSGDATLFNGYPLHEIGYPLDHFIRRDLRGKFTCGGRLQGAPVALNGKLILLLTADVPLPRHVLGGDTHAVANGDMVVVENGRTERGLVAAHRNHAHVFGAGRNHDVGLTETNTIGRQRHRLQAGRTKTVDRQTRHGVGQTRQQQGNARHIHALLGLWHRATGDHIINGVRVEAGALGKRRLQHVREQIVGAHVLEHATWRLANRGSRGGDDISVLNLLGHHVLLFRSIKSEARGLRHEA